MNKREERGEMGRGMEGGRVKDDGKKREEMESKGEGE